MKLYEVEEALAKAVAATEQYLEKVQTLPTIEVLRTYARLKASTDALKKTMTKLNALAQHQQYNVVPNIMKANGIRNFTDDELMVRFGISSRWSCKILDKPLGYQWLRENGAEALIVETVNAQTLGAFAGSRAEDEGLDMPEGIFEAKQASYATVTKIKPKG